MTARETRELAMNMAATAEEASNEADRRATALMLKGESRAARMAVKDSVRLYGEAQAYRRMALIMETEALKEAMGR